MSRLVTNMRYSSPASAHEVGIGTLLVLVSKISAEVVVLCSESGLIVRVGFTSPFLVMPDVGVKEGKEEDLEEWELSLQVRGVL